MTAIFTDLFTWLSENKNRQLIRQNNSTDFLDSYTNAYTTVDLFLIKFLFIYI